LWDRKGEVEQNDSLFGKRGNGSESRMTVYLEKEVMEVNDA